MSLFGLFGRVLNRVDDMRVAGATAEVAFQTMDDFFSGGARVCLQEMHSGHDHSRRAVAALQRMAFPKSLLHGVQFAIAGQALDRGHFGTIGLNREERAGLDCFAVEKDRAGAANARFTTHMSPSQAAVIPQEMDQQRSRIDFFLSWNTVNPDGDACFHRCGVADRASLGCLKADYRHFASGFK